MKITQSFKMALAAIFSNKMRSFLTMLGVIIGVFAVVVLISIGQGATNSILSEFDSLGTNLISVSVFSSRHSVDISEAESFRDLEGIEYSAPVMSGRSDVRHGGESLNVSINGTNEDFLPANKIELSSGRNLNRTDMENRFNVAVIGYDIADELFGYQDVVGESIRIKGMSFQIIGVVEKQAESIMGSNNAMCLIPASVGERLLQMRGISEIVLAAEEDADVMQVKSTAEAMLLDLVGEDNYYIYSAQEMLDIVDSTMATMTVMLGGIAAISLLVGGIGIMNIMLVSVTERTREIGIRKAIGAKRRNILSQFLIEAVVITVMGGLIAIALSHITLILVGDAMNVDMAMSPQTVTLGIGFCVFIGLLFGVYPANKASKLNPIDALRHE